MLKKITLLGLFVVLFISDAKAELSKAEKAENHIGLLVRSGAYELLEKAIKSNRRYLMSKRHDFILSAISSIDCKGNVLQLLIDKKLKVNSKHMSAVAYSGRFDYQKFKIINKIKKLKIKKKDVALIVYNAIKSVRTKEEEVANLIFISLLKRKDISTGLKDSEVGYLISAAHKNPAYLKALVEKGVKLNHKDGKELIYPLFKFPKKNDDKILDIFLSSGIDVNKLFDKKKGQSPIFALEKIITELEKRKSNTTKKQPDIYKFLTVLIKHGLDINIKDALDKKFIDRVPAYTKAFILNKMKNPPKKKEAPKKKWTKEALSKMTKKEIITLFLRSQE